MADFKDRLKKLRKENKLYQKDLANRLNVGRTTIANYEQGSRFPDKNMLNNLADFFNVSVDYLLGRTDQRQPIGQTTEAEEKIKQALTDDPELLEFFDEMTQRDDLQMFFKQCRELSPSTIKRLIKISKIFEEEERERHGG
ncbi:helix-turn-helix transcriptional regulator [Natroniella acetigena]|uniref:helix-turn-helix domain-containing protein n=1 Tax=Natroniella acetigena TaxID=52004 RepID=UPI00200A3000|nr:helix-turn-helix transcriptional regulator [Natroniella acetigena]MCK8827703.1 helix-turn-helix transcriptional regulator [Natroniella acetigena]